MPGCHCRVYMVEMVAVMAVVATINWRRNDFRWLIYDDDLLVMMLLGFLWLLLLFRA